MGLWARIWHRAEPSEMPTIPLLAGAVFFRLSSLLIPSTVVPPDGSPVAALPREDLGGFPPS